MTAQHRVFISYSRRDASIAKKVIELGLAFGVESWRDKDDLRPGEDWRIVITETIASCDRVMVLWCRHSQASSEVRNEFMQALHLRKRISSVQLDRAALPPELRHLHAIDVSRLTWWAHEIARMEVGLVVLGIACLAAGGLIHALL